MIRLKAMLGHMLSGHSSFVLLLFALAVLPGCSGRPPANEHAKSSPVAQSSPKFAPLPAMPSAPVWERVASQGDCAPHSLHGGWGTCINGKACLGFGVHGENGNAVCSCYGRTGGCAQGQRCDALQLACVPEKQPPSGRGDAD